MLLSFGDSSGKLGQGYLAEKDSNGTKPAVLLPFPRSPLAARRNFELDPFSFSRVPWKEKWARAPSPF